MSKPSSGLFAGTMGSAADTSLGFGRSEKQISKTKPQSMAPERIRFSQTSVNGSEQIVESMKKNGWQGDPVDVVMMDDGELTTLDNTRVVAARAAGIDVMAIVHAYSDPIPGETMRRRFTTPRGGTPQTWGQAVENRIGKQSSRFRRSYPRGSYNVGKVN